MLFFAQHQILNPKENVSMTEASEPAKHDNIEKIPGSTNILLIAPHGHPKNDKNTGKLVRALAEQNGFYAIINETYRRADSVETASKDDKRINVNHLGQVETHLQEEFLAPLLEYKNEIVEKYGNPLIFWIHGAGNKSVEGDVSGADVNPKEIKVLVGYGQKTGKNRDTADEKTVENLINALNENGLNAVLANPDKKANHKKGIRTYCGWDKNNLNQLFQSEEYKDPKVQSFQLEFRKAGCRGKVENIKTTASQLSHAITAIVQPDVKNMTKENTSANTPQVDVVDKDDEKVEKAYAYLKSIFHKHFQNAMLECGQYLVQTFYDGKYDEITQEKKFTSNKSLSRLFKRMKQDAEEKGNVPSRTWLYDAVNLAIDNHLYEQKFLPSVYGQLGHSHKVNLTSAPYEVKPKLVQESVENKYTVTKIRKRIKEEKNKQRSDHIPLKDPMSIDRLKNLSSKQLNELKTKTEGLFKKVQDEAMVYQGNLDLIRQVLETKED
jgi:hypothetical protein